MWWTSVRFVATIFVVSTAIGWGSFSQDLNSMGVISKKLGWSGGQFEKLLTCLKMAGAPSQVINDQPLVCKIWCTHNIHVPQESTLHIHCNFWNTIFNKSSLAISNARIEMIQCRYKHILQPIRMHYQCATVLLSRLILIYVHRSTEKLHKRTTHWV